MSRFFPPLRGRGHDADGKVRGNDGMRILARRDTPEMFESAGHLVPGVDEVVIEIHEDDHNLAKIGDGEHSWAELPYVDPQEVVELLSSRGMQVWPRGRVRWP